MCWTGALGQQSRNGSLVQKQLPGSQHFLPGQHVSVLVTHTTSQPLSISTHEINIFSGRNIDLATKLVWVMSVLQGNPRDNLVS